MATLLPDHQTTSGELHGYRIFIWSHDHPVPPHVHVGKGRRVSSWELPTFTCIDQDGFSSSELRIQRKILMDFAERIWERWHAHWTAQNHS